MNLLLLGPQGSGKGTQAKLLITSFGFYYIESGGILREAAKTNQTIDRLINKEGKLLPDDITFSLIMKKIEKEKPQRDGILFDGFPRSIAQYQLLSDWLKGSGKKIDLAILIDISEEVSISRLSGRRVCARCGKIWNVVTSPKPPAPDRCDCSGDLIQREDDKPKAIRVRLKEYHDVTGPLVEMLDDQGILFRVGGEGPIDLIQAEIAKVINR
jgi:adenylate kinase